MRAGSRSIFFGMCFFITHCAAQSISPFVLKGTVIAPTGALQNSFISISGNRIAQIEKTLNPAQQALETDSYIFPGLIDLHDHITWNFLPRWNPGEQFNNRYEWQSKAAYKIALDGPHGRILADHTLACDADRFGEIKAIVGGATAVVGGLGPTPDTDDNRCIIGLVRNLDTYAGFDDSILNKEKLRYEVFPFEMGLSDSTQVRAGLDSGGLKALFIHVGEGRASDAATVREFRMLAKRGDGFLHTGVSVIHGVAFGKSEFMQMAASGVGLIWSPRSNVELYGVTADVRTAKESGVKIAIAPDWSPSGSDGMLEELKYAATWNASQSPPVFSETELAEMATTIPAQLAGVDKQIGALTANLYADLLLLNRVDDNPYHALLHADPTDVRLVIIGGTPIYGDRDLMERLLPGKYLESISVCGKVKMIYMEAHKGVPESGKTFKQISEELESKVRLWGTSLAELATCRGTNLN